MAGTTIVRTVTEALLEILRAKLTPMVDPSRIRAAPPEEIDGVTDETLLLFLYQVIESPFLRNVGPRVELQPPPMDPGVSRGVTIHKDPLALDLYYLLIPGANSDPDAADAYLDTYDILGAGMLAFHDQGTFTLGEFATTAPVEEKDLQFRIDFNRLDMSDLIRVWEAVQKPYRLSVSYVVRTLQLDSVRSTDTRIVSERTVQVSQT